MEKYPYSIGSAVIYSTALLATLWWIPILGPIIIGYITGRKAGGPLKGILAMAIPVAFYFLIVHAIHKGWINIPPMVHTYFSGTILTSTALLPFIDYIEKTTQIAMNVALSFEKFIYYAPPSFFIMFSFAFIGGAVSRQVILERGIYKEKKPLFQKREKEERHSPRPFNAKTLTPKPEYSEDPSYERMHRAPVEYDPYQQPVYANPRPTYPNNYPQYGYQGYQPPQHQAPQQYQPQRYPQYQMYEPPHQYNPYNPPRAQPQIQENEEYEEEIVKIPKKKTRRRRKKIKQFQVEENNKFVVHPMDPPRNIKIRKKNVNNDHSIAFL